MIAATSFALVILAAAGLSAESLYFEGITVEQFAEGVRREASEQCLRRSAIEFDSIDPLYLDTFTIRAGEFLLTNKYSALTGLGNAVLSDVKWSLDKSMATLQLSANITLTGDYESSGKFLFLPMTGAGSLTVYGYDLKADITLKFKKVLIKSVEYMQIYDLKSVQSFGLLRFDLKSDGSCSTADTLANAALNANWGLFEPAGCSAAAKMVTQKVQKDLNKMLLKVPYDELIKYM